MSAQVSNKSIGEVMTAQASHLLYRWGNDDTGNLMTAQLGTSQLVVINWQSSDRVWLKYRMSERSRWSHLFSPFQLRSQGSGGATDDQVDLDVHAISDLQGRGIPVTNDLPKYRYSADDEGNYSKHSMEKIVLSPKQYSFWVEMTSKCLGLIKVLALTQKLRP